MRPFSQSGGELQVVGVRFLATVEGVADGTPVPLRFTPDELERTIAEQRIDRVIVTSPDFTHAELVSRSLLAGADVVYPEGIRMIADAIRARGTTT